MEDKKEDSTLNLLVAQEVKALKELMQVKMDNQQKTLERIEENSKNFVTRNEHEETKRDFNLTIKRIEDAFNKHNEDDKVSFSTITSGQTKLRESFKYWAGGLAVLIFLVALIAPVFFHFVFKF